MIVRTSIAGAALALVLTAAAAAQPAPVQQGYSLDGQHIVARTQAPYGDLNLSTAAGQRTLMQRLEAAADAVCGGPAQTGDRYHHEAYLLCRDTAVRSAVAQLPPPARERLAALRDRGGPDATGW
jgi:UrcA family protein